MENRNWHGIMKVIELKHFDTQGKLIYEHHNLLNLLHQEGEEFLLRAAFTGGQVSSIIPEFYYLGLDNRATIAFLDTMDNIIGEPLSNGYVRQAVSSSGDFAINLDQTHFLATSPIVAFVATTGNWGPVSNLFLTNKNDNTGSLISTVALPSPVFLSAGQSVTMRIGLTLKDCP